MNVLGIPELSLVILVGSSGSGKSTFAKQHFGHFETLSSDFFRGLVSNDENNQQATKDAFEALKYVAAKRLDAGLLTVIDATNVQADARKDFVTLARAHDVLPVAIVLDIPAQECQRRNMERTDRNLPPEVIARQQGQLRRSLTQLSKEGFRKVHVLRGTQEVAKAVIKREPLLNDFKHLTGPFDAIGDVHGCLSELSTLLQKLGYVISHDSEGRAIGARHTEGRTAIFLGDLVDRGPDSPGVLRLVMGMVRDGQALAVPGNHEDKLVRALDGKAVKTGHGLAETLNQLAGESAEFRAEVREFARGLVSHLVLDGGKLVVAHAGLPQRFHGRASARVRAFSLYGDTSGETDAYGLPVRYQWAADYRGSAMVLYGHVPTLEAEWVNGTMCLDTGCVFGGKLSALRYPEREVLSVPAERVWCDPVKPLSADLQEETSAGSNSPERTPGILKISDVLGKQVIQTGTHGRIGIREQQAAGALEVMSRWAIDPRWMPYLPPTMSPPGASKVEGYLEHPSEAFEAYRREGVMELICEEKHMGSRAVVVLTRNVQRFDAPHGWRGTVYTRTGRPFFAEATMSEFLTRLDAAFESAGLWRELDSDWAVLDAEVLPWSLKAGDMIRSHYASVGAAATSGLRDAASALQTAVDRGIAVQGLLEAVRGREGNAAAYVEAYRRYSAPAHGLQGVQLAPFQLLASEGSVHVGKEHRWHLDIADRLAAADPELIKSTQRVVVYLNGSESIENATAWWMEMTGAGGEGMVVKPLANLRRNGKNLVQPGIKVRGREYLRIIYGPDYLKPENLRRLKDRSVTHKRSMALREYALGVEALERFVAREPLWRVHQAVFGVLAMESEPVDPRL